MAALTDAATASVSRLLEEDDMAEETETVSTAVGLFLGILMVAQMVTTALLKWCPKLMLYVPEVGVVILVGIVASMVCQAAGVGNRIDVFDPTIFFVGLLPPIIFNSGYHLKRQLFFSNLPAIFTMAICGTITSAVLIAYGLYLLAQADLIGGLDLTAAQCWTFGSLISATDPVSTLVLFAELRVEPNLFYLVFGESVMNDAVGLVLFETTREFITDNKGTTFILNSVLNFCVVLAGSLLLGVFLSIVMAAIMRRAAMRNNPVLEQGLFLNFIFMPYVIGEVCNLSGIVTTLTSGLAARKFLTPNLSEKSEESIEHTLRVMANLAETAAFLDLGLTCVQYNSEHYRPLLWMWAVILCLISRPFMVYLYSSILNFVTGRAEVNRKNQHMLGFAGLRGVVAFACATMWPDDDEMRKIWISTTSLVVLFTVFVQGGLTPLVLKWLEIPLNCDENLTPVKPYPWIVRYCVRFTNTFIVPATNPRRGGYNSDLDLMPDSAESTDTVPEQQLTSTQRLRSKNSVPPGEGIDENNLAQLKAQLDDDGLGRSLLPTQRRIMSTPGFGADLSFAPAQGRTFEQSARRRSVYDYVNVRARNPAWTNTDIRRSFSQGYTGDTSRTFTPNFGAAAAAAPEEEGGADQDTSIRPGLSNSLNQDEGQPKRSITMA